MEGLCSTDNTQLRSRSSKQFQLFHYFRMHTHTHTAQTRVTLPRATLTQHTPGSVQPHHGQWISQRGGKHALTLTLRPPSCLTLQSSAQKILSEGETSSQCFSAVKNSFLLAFRKVFFSLKNFGSPSSTDRQTERSPHDAN
jgi:hypothetical protein